MVTHHRGQQSQCSPGSTQLNFVDVTKCCYHYEKPANERHCQYSMHKKITIQKHSWGTLTPTSMTVAWSSSEYIIRLASIVCASSHSNAMRFPIPSPVCADVGTIDMYSRRFLFSLNNATFKPCNPAPTWSTKVIKTDVHVAPKKN